ncbi:MAG: lytic transglycosylase, partial [Rhodanobacteraceae bacterium]
LAAAWLFLHPERYNLRFPQIDGAPGHIILQRPASLTELAVCLGQAGGQRYGWFRTLRNLNPQLDPQVQEPMGTRIELPKSLEDDYTRLCTGNSRWLALAEDLHSAVLPTPPAQMVAQTSEDPPPRARHYMVKRGDTLSSVARKFRCDDTHALAKANHLHAPHYALKAGQELTLSGCGRD